MVILTRARYVVRVQGSTESYSSVFRRDDGRDDERDDERDDTGMDAWG
jgi:hypothetical protein